MTDTVQDPGGKAGARLLAWPVALVGDAAGLPPGTAILCRVACECPDLMMYEGEDVVVVIPSHAAPLPADLLASLGTGGEEADADVEEGRILAFEGCRESGRAGDEGHEVFAARSWGGRRPSRAQAEEAIAAFLAEELGEEHVPFELHEDGDEDSAPRKCGWAFWVRSEDTTSYLHENLQVEWYGTGWTLDGETDEEDEAEDADLPAP